MDMKQKRIREIYLLKAISLEEIFDSNEIDEILKEKTFWNNNLVDEELETKQKNLTRFKKHNMEFDKGTLVMKLLSIAIDKLKQTNNKAISKGLNWVRTEIQDKLVSDTPTGIKSKTIEDQVDIKNIMSWIDEYGTSNVIEEKTKKRYEPTIYKKKEIQNLDLNPKHRHSINTINFQFQKNKVEKINTMKLRKVENIGNDIINNFVSDSMDLKTKKKYHKKTHSTSNFDELPKNNILSCGLLVVDENVSKAINSKTFDIWEYEKTVGRDNCLPFLCYEIFFNYDLYTVININTMEKFTESIRDGYLKNNPYHNDIHASDILHTSYSMTIHSNIISTLNLDCLDLAALFIASMIHDYKHPGVTNGFLMNTRDKLAIKYNDYSVLENYHVAEAFKLIKEKETNIFSMLSISEYKMIRKKIIDGVLATDMTKHAHGYHYLKMKVETYQINQGKNMDKILLGLDESEINKTKQEFINTVIHLADISNPTKPLKVYKEWAERCMSEFWLQGDKERELGIPFSFLCDRRTTKLPGAQMGFMNGIVLPLTQTFIEMFPTLSYMIDNITANSEYYKKLKDEDK